jgi:hypothetical protein
VHIKPRSKQQATSPDCLPCYYIASLSERRIDGWVWCAVVVAPPSPSPVGTGQCSGQSLLRSCPPADLAMGARVLWFSLKGKEPSPRYDRDQKHPRLPGPTYRPLASAPYDSVSIPSRQLLRDAGPTTDRDRPWGLAVGDMPIGRCPVWTCGTVCCGE